VVNLGGVKDKVLPGANVQGRKPKPAPSIIETMVVWGGKGEMTA